MVRELVIQGWCDVCLANTENVASVKSYTVSVNDTSGEVDLCEAHAPAMEEVVEFLQEFGTPSDAAPVVGQPKPQVESKYSRTGPKRVMGNTGKLVDKDGPAARTCPVCTTVAASRGAMRDHLKRTHKTTLSQLGLVTPRGRYGQALKAEREARLQPVLATG